MLAGQSLFQPLPVSNVCICKPTVCTWRWQDSGNHWWAPPASCLIAQVGVDAIFWHCPLWMIISLAVCLFALQTGRHTKGLTECCCCVRERILMELSWTKTGCDCFEKNRSRMGTKLNIFKTFRDHNSRHCKESESASFTRIILLLTYLMLLLHLELPTSCSYICHSSSCKKIIIQVQYGMQPELPGSYFWHNALYFCTPPPRQHRLQKTGTP